MPAGYSQITLLTDDIKDPIVKDNFQRVQEEFRRTILNQGNWYPFELDVRGSVSSHQYKHRMGFQPRDIILTSQIGPGTVTFNYDKFTREFLVFTTTGRVIFRFFAGAYFEDIGA